MFIDFFEDGMRMVIIFKSFCMIKVIEKGMIKGRKDYDSFCLVILYIKMI